MGIEWSSESVHAKELSKWNRPKRDGGMNCNGFEQYPRMLYKAQQNPLSNRFEVLLPRDVISLDKTTVLLSAEAFNASCQMTVSDQREFEAAKADGWRESPKEAMAYYESLQQDIAVAAAERAYQDRNMSEKAKAEVAKVEAASPVHVAEIPEQPKKRKPMSEEAKAKLRDTLAKAREVKAAKKKAVEAT